LACFGDLPGLVYEMGKLNRDKTWQVFLACFGDLPGLVYEMPATQKLFAFLPG
jgi:hypothetical protein